MTALLSKIRRALREVADASRSPAMQSYMKSEMPFHGVPATQLRGVTKRIFSAHPVDDAARWRADVLGVWEGSTHREERYAAIELSGDRRAKPFHTMEALPMYEQMIVEGAWWDYVDAIAAHRLGLLLRNEPMPMKKTMRTWSKSEDMWKRRSSIICQLTFKKDIDLELLSTCIAPSLGRKEFFLRKAIGWALRSHAKCDQDWVVAYVRAHEEELSPLSKREALKNVGKDPSQTAGASPARGRPSKRSS
jgi:3-methyladenine DNA glycosylase AlkD